MSAPSTVAEATKGMNWTGSGLHFSGLGHYYPRELVRNEGEVSIGGRTYSPEAVEELGVKSLHRADEEESVAYMAEQAARNALARAGREPGELDLVILANWTDRQWIPEIGPEVTARLGADRALAFDVCGACTGFVHGVQVAASMLAAQPTWKRAVVVAADRFTRRARPGTRGQLIFGDAAGAVVLERGEADREGLLQSTLACDASQADTVAARDGWLRPRPELIELAIGSSLKVAGSLLDSGGIGVPDLDWLIPHPGNNAIHAGVKSGLTLPPEKFLTNFAERGNTGCASIPIALSEFSEANLVKPGDLVLSTAVGSGWYYGGLLFRV
ncbi:MULTISPECIES: ketoacyl-ACP synthase III [Streptomyces]|uniref:Type III beta-ketoacyl synthase-like protein n=1 Tax=Streptomyces albus (strain ATCC 21838 / DSM 41398 / FERM P-419 / JCM 4703 / NBRC 107858) TaxID=1081613 RepID=A0A0B5EQL2_STRA4|nr:ketoacyl-ACP synthase III [Streptomyces sp. SCSIO ZS0520]AJE85058.1 type III beta-ketoacyl synthase-like protein [Streptomyces albus]AOU79365.1 type III beta-ketoacyl synthase-like protein [Streptomyces albus]AYN35091.1 type III beta-ketoacyl synthase-like protein [Streptomyces albus]